MKKNTAQRAENYGITADQLLALEARQGGLCAICSKPCTEGRSLSVDHCHVTQNIRGLLCRACNIGLGSFRDSPDLLARAASYLKAAKRKPAVSANRRVCAATARRVRKEAAPMLRILARRAERAAWWRSKSAEIAAGAQAP